MDAQQFLAEFQHIANTVGGIDRLRDLVLELAIQGRLVNAEGKRSTLELLSEISQWRRENAKSARGRRAVDYAYIEEREKPYAIPKHWAWVRNVDLFSLVKGKNPKDLGASGKYAYLDIEALERGNIQRYTNDERAPRTSDADILVVCDGSRSGLVLDGKNGVIGSTLGRIDTFKPIKPFVRFIFLHSYRRLNSQKKGAAIPHLDTARLLVSPCGLPPLEEQAQIIAKVDELMALCDKLEAEQQERRKVQNALRQSTLQAVADAQRPQELKTTWARLEANFGRLFKEPEDVNEIRKIAMDLAVRGLLTDQRDADEPSDPLLERIAVEQQQMVAAGEMKRPKPLPPIRSATAPFELPRGWAWARFPELGLFGRGKSKHRPRNDPRLFTPGLYPLVQTGEVARANGIITEYHSKYSDLGLAQSKLWPRGTLCITIAANIADSAILGFDACFPDSVVGFIPASEIRDEVEYFLLFMRTAKERLLAFAPSTAQKNINLDILQSVLIPIPPKNEMKRILSKVRVINTLCDRLIDARAKSYDLGALLNAAAITSLTGIAIEREEDEPVKVPETELLAPLRLGQTPDIKAQAPLATLLVRHNGEMSATDLWQRFGGEIDAFYDQLKTEVAHGWIQEPSVAEMREKVVDAAGS